MSNIPKRLHGWKWGRYWKLLLQGSVVPEAGVNVQRDWGSPGGDEGRLPQEGGDWLEMHFPVRAAIE